MGTGEDHQSNVTTIRGGVSRETDRWVLSAGGPGFAGGLGHGFLPAALRNADRNLPGAHGSAPKR